MPALPSPRDNSSADADAALVMPNAFARGGIEEVRLDSGATGRAELQISALPESFQRLALLLSQGDFPCSATDIHVVLRSLALRQKAWSPGPSANEPPTLPPAFVKDSDRPSPVSEMFLLNQQIELLRNEIISRNEKIPSELGPRIFTHEPRLHAQILMVAIDSLLDQSPGIPIKGSISALFSFLQSQGPPVHRFGIDALSFAAPAERRARLEEGQQAMRNVLTSEPYLAFIKMLRDGSIIFHGESIAINKIRFLGDSESELDSISSREIKGANPAFVIEGTLPRGAPVSLLIKKEGTDLANHFAMSRIVAAFDLRSYRVSSLFGQNDEEVKDWLIIEKLASDFLAFTNARIFQTDNGITQLGNASAFTNWLVAREIGAIFALEYACAAQDCWARHILLERDTNKPFRIDWEQVFQFEDPFNLAAGSPYCMQGDETKLLDAFIAGTAHLFGQETEFMQRVVLNGFIYQLDRMRWDVNSKESKVVSILEGFFSSRRADEIVEVMKKRLAEDWHDVVNKLFENPPPLFFDLILE